MEILERGFLMKHSPTAACHASTVLEKEDGGLLFAWFGGSREGEPDVGIYLCKRAADGRFSLPKRVASSGEAHWNPVLFSTEKGTVYLFYKVGNQIRDWRTCIQVSRDGGETFGEEQELIPGDLGGRGPVRNKPVRLKNGRILCPGSQEGEIWTAFVDISDDAFKSFRKSIPISIPGLKTGSGPQEDRIPVSSQSFEGRGVIQPTLWEEGDGRVHMLLRSSEGVIYRSDSTDWGETWSGAYPTSIPNNNSGIDLVKLEDGRLLLVHNPVGDNWGNRSPLTLSCSWDGGEHFEKVLDLETGEGEFSYPAIISGDGQVWITYTYRRENIAYCHLKV